MGEKSRWQLQSLNSTFLVFHLYFEKDLFKMLNLAVVFSRKLNIFWLILNPIIFPLFPRETEMQKVGKSATIFAVHIYLLMFYSTICVIYVHKVTFKIVQSSHLYTGRMYYYNILLLDILLHNFTLVIIYDIFIFEVKRRKQSNHNILLFSYFFHNRIIAKFDLFFI